MERVTIDCVTGKEIRVRLSAQEESARLAEAQAALLETDRQKVKERRKAFLRTSLELREMKLNPLIFNASEIAEKQAELDALRE